MNCITIDSDYPAYRKIHLFGGICASTEHSKTINLNPNCSDNSITIESDYKDAYKTIIHAGLQIVGVEFYSRKAMFDGRISPEWRTFDHNNENPWLSENIKQDWEGVAYSAYILKNEYAFDLARRISSQLGLCNYRIQQASISYQRELLAQVKGAASKQEVLHIGNQFVDTFTSPAYASIQSYLIDACILRDYLAEFIWHFICKPNPESFTSNKSCKDGITSMGPLLKILNPINDKTLPVIRYIFEQNQIWLRKMGNHRDLVVHSAPLSSTRNQLYAIIDIIKLADGKKIPAITLPLPTEISPHPSPCNEQSRDALQYICECQSNMTRLSARVLEESPYKPSIPVFDQTNIIGGLHFHNG